MDLHTERRGTSPNFRNHLKLPLTNVKKCPKRATLSLQTPQVLSPLILSPYEDIECAGCPFTLEEPLHNEEHNSSKGKQSGSGGRHRLNKMDPNFPFRGACLGRSKACESDILKDWRSQTRLISSASTSKRTSQGSFLGAWEVSSSDELDIFDQPQNLNTLPYFLSERRKQQIMLARSNKKSFEFKKESFGSSQNRSEGSTLNDPHFTELHICMSPISQKYPLGTLQTTTPLSTMACRQKSTMTDDGMCSPVESEKSSYATYDEAGPKSGSTKKADKTAELSMANEGSFPTSGMELAVFVDQPSRSLSQKYRPKLFEELVGQDLVAQALSSAILKGKIAPVYLFHGSRGTGKTSTARILAAALNCLMMSVEMRPCTFCSQCKALAMGKSSGVCWEVDAASHNGVDNVWALLQSTLSTQSSSRYKVFIIDECHMLSVETWNALLKFLEEPPGDFVFILVTTDPDRLPRTASSRCQKFSFLKIKHSDILKRLNKLATLERLDVEYGALDLIASRSDGSLRDAEMTLDQLSLSEQTITYSAVLDLVGSVSDEKLLHLLDLALGPDTVSTVQKAKELVDSGIEPLNLMTRLARLITDILAGSYKLLNRDRNQFVSRHTCSKEGLEGLSAALKILLEAEKQLRAAHHDRMAWLTAALLQFGHHQKPRFLHSSSASASASPPPLKNSRNVKLRESKGILLTKWVSTRNILNKMNPHCEHGNHASTYKPKARLSKPNLEARIHPTVYPFPDDLTSGVSVESSEAGASPFSSKESERHASFLGPGNLGSIWLNILKGCKSLPLRQLLSHGKLLAVCFSTVEAMVHLEFKDPEQKSRAERYRKVIASTCKKGLGHSVNVKISLASRPVGKQALSPPMPLLAADKTFTGQDEPVNASRLECGFIADANSAEVGSLHYWRRQSGKSSQVTPEHAYLTNNAAMSTLTSEIYDKLPVYEGCLDVLKSKIPYESHEDNKACEANEVSPSRVGYWQDLSVAREPQKSVRCSEIVVTNAALTFDGQQAQKPASPGYEVVRSNLDEENLRPESQSKYGGLLCWRVPKAEEEKPLQVGKPFQRRSCGSLIHFMPCAKARRD